MTLPTQSSSASSSAKTTLERVLRNARFKSQGEFSVLSHPSQAALEDHKTRVRSGSHDQNGPFADRTPILGRKTSQATDEIHKKKLTIEGRIELITLRETVVANGYLTKKQVKAIKDNVWEYPVLSFIQEKAPGWKRKNIILEETLHYIPAEKLEILFSTTWARNFMDINPFTIFEQLDKSWTTIRNFIQQLDDLKKIKQRDDLTDQLLSLYQHKILKMEVSIQYNLDDLVQLIENITAARDLNILTNGGSLIQSKIISFSKRAIDLLFLEQYGLIFSSIIRKSPIIRNELLLLAKTPVTEPNYGLRMIQMEQILILYSKGRYTSWLLENKVFYLSDLWSLTGYGQYTKTQKKACRRAYHYFQEISQENQVQYKKYCKSFRVRMRENHKLFSLIGEKKIDIGDIILGQK